MLRTTLLSAVVVWLIESLSPQSASAVTKKEIVGTWRVTGLSDKRDRLVKLPPQADITLTFRRDERCAFAVTMKSSVNPKEIAIECRYQLHGATMSLTMKKPNNSKTSLVNVRLTNAGHLIMIDPKSKSVLTLIRIR
ncbi:MAG: hypothetical protein KC609_26125 [Myxococcales bacterium]|nr:hypothetical protein [Myxococcales bacterium]